MAPAYTPALHTKGPGFKPLRKHILGSSCRVLQQIICYLNNCDPIVHWLKDLIYESDLLYMQRVLGSSPKGTTNP